MLKSSRMKRKASGFDMTDWLIRIYIISINMAAQIASKLSHTADQWNYIRKLAIMS